MEITLFRKTEINNTVLGELHVNGKFFCYTLEDKIRDVKIKHQTCIPPGNYKILLTLSQRFKTILPILLNVPNFEGIRIHAGNTIEDTSGCILVGTAIANDKLLHSKVALQELMAKIKTAVKNKEVISIEVKNPEKPVTPKVSKKNKVEVSTQETQPVEVPTPVVETVKPVEPITPQLNIFNQLIQWILKFISKN
jgi:hypothetical protein